METNPYDYVDEWELEFENDMSAAEEAMRLEPPKRSTTLGEEGMGGHGERGMGKGGIYGDVKRVLKMAVNDGMEANKEELSVVSGNDRPEKIRRVDRNGLEGIDSMDLDSSNMDMTSSMDFENDDHSGMSLLNSSVKARVSHLRLKNSNNTLLHDTSSLHLPMQTLDYLFKRPPENGRTLTCTLLSGERFFLKTCDRVNVQDKSSLDQRLLITPIEQLLENLEKRKIEEIVAKDHEEANPKQKPQMNAVHNTALWLDKYAPNKFMDLLSDEKTNREVLKWLKGWDSFVFNKAPPTSSKFIFSSENASEKKSEDVRPLEKVILLCGPPGCGKTTLAHIVAKHAGYNTLEINASDDRSSKFVTEKLIPALNTQSISECLQDGSDVSKPTCIILDEIDGAMNGGDKRNAINQIVEIIQTELKQSNSKSKTSTKQPLTRPLICVCNDLYASVLRPLRKHARIFMFTPPKTTQLLGRLKSICAREELSVSNGTLAAMCDRGNNDIRFCLNALQMAKYQCSTLTPSKMQEILGTKDQSLGMFDAWNTVFHQKKRMRISMEKAEEPTSSFLSVYDTINSSGDQDTILQGLHENLYSMSFNDPTLRKTFQCMDMIGFADECLHSCLRHQNYSLMNYAPVSAYAVHAAFRSSSRRKIMYPKNASEFRMLRERAVSTLASLSEGSRVLPMIRLNNRAVVLEILPSLLAILSPPIRDVQSSTVLKNAALQKLISLMASMGLSYKEIYHPTTGSQSYELDPPIHHLIQYKDMPLDSTKELPIVARKLVTREVHLQTMRIDELAMGAKLTSNAKKMENKAKESNKDEPEGKTAPIVPLLNEDKIKENEERIRKSNPYAYAHRKADESKKRATNNTLKDTKCMQFRYKFQGGYTCGIKRVVTISDFL